MSFLLSNQNTKGHMAQDCFHRPGDQKYELVDEEELAATPENSVDAKESHHDKVIFCTL